MNYLMRVVFLSLFIGVSSFSLFSMQPKYQSKAISRDEIILFNYALNILPSYAQVKYVWNWNAYLNAQYINNEDVEGSDNEQKN